MKQTDPRNSSFKSGFTLAELLLAMLVFAVAITTILALLARSIETVDEILVKDEAMRLSGTVEDEFQSQAFSTVYNWVSNLGSGSEVKVLAYTYRGDPESPRSDGTLTPVSSRAGVLGEDYIITRGVRRITGSFVPRLLTDDLAALEGRVFLVEYELSPNNPVDPGDMTPTSDTYPSAVLVLSMNYYPIPDLNNRDVDALGISPAFSYSFAVRR